MDIRGWGLGRIMELPDCCFGRRYMVTCSILTTEAGTLFDIAELSFPEVCVIWGLHIWSGEVASGDANLRIALADQLPVTVAIFNGLEPLFPGVGIQGPAPRVIRIGPSNPIVIPELKIPVQTAGRRMAIELTNGVGDIVSIMVAVVVSGVPKEVPDWICSVNLRNR